MKIKLKEGYPYGRLVYYPQDEKGNLLLRLMNQPWRKCFVVAQLDTIRELGYEIEIDPFKAPC